MLDLILLLFGLVALAAGIALLVNEIRFHRTYRAALRQRHSFAGPVSIIMPVRGVDAHFAATVRALFLQDYPHPREYLFVVDSMDDDAVPLLKTFVRRTQNARIVVAPSLLTSSGKNAALLAGVAHAKHGILVFVDSDAIPKKNWLRHLVAHLDAAPVATGFRLYVPQQSYLRCAWNVIGLRLMFGNHTFAWGGSMAMRRQTFRQLDLARRWRRSLSDDATVTRALRERQQQPIFAPQCLLATKSPFRWREFLAFGNRQLAIVRVYFPEAHRAALLVLGGKAFLTILGVAALALGFFVPAALLLALIPLDLLRDWYAFRSYRRMIGVRGSALHYAFAAFAASLVMVYNVLHAIGRNTITWRGRTYRMHGPERIVRIGP